MTDHVPIDGISRELYNEMVGVYAELVDALERLYPRRIGTWFTCVQCKLPFREKEGWNSHRCCAVRGLPVLRGLPDPTVILCPYEMGVCDRAGCHPQDEIMVQCEWDKDLDKDNVEIRCTRVSCIRCTLLCGRCYLRICPFCRSNHFDLCEGHGKEELGKRKRLKELENKVEKLRKELK